MRLKLPFSTWHLHGYPGDLSGTAFGKDRVLQQLLRGYGFDGFLIRVGNQLHLTRDASPFLENLFAVVVNIRHLCGHALEFMAGREHVNIAQTANGYEWAGKAPKSRLHLWLRGQEETGDALWTPIKAGQRSGRTGSLCELADVVAAGTIFAHTKSGATYKHFSGPFSVSS